MTGADDVGISREKTTVWMGTGQSTGDVGVESSEPLPEAMVAMVKRWLFWKDRERGRIT